MGLGKGVGHWYCDIERCARLERLARNAVRQSLAIDVLHYDEAAAIFFRNFIDRADVWMIEPGRRPCFTEQALLRLLICCGFRWQELDRHSAVERCVLGEIDFTHSARADFLDDLITRDRDHLAVTSLSEIRSMNGPATNAEDSIREQLLCQLCCLLPCSNDFSRLKPIPSRIKSND